MSVVSIKDLKEYYQSQKDKSCLSLFKDDFFQIVLIRHGEPDLKKVRWYTRAEAIEYSSQYDKVGIRHFKKNPICTDGLPVDKVYHSSIPRARHSAELLFGTDFDLVSDYRFREFEKNIFRFFNFPLPLKFWTFLSRILWFFGISHGKTEGFFEAKRRAKENADHLEQKAKKEKMVLLVAHGWHNRYMIKYLKMKEWSLVYKGGTGYLAINILAKKNN
ncbi:MAG: histidine phosphatase family protein [Candidatus Cyclobacteriaceae bacterium M2_1C_046]